MNTDINVPQDDRTVFVALEGDPSAHSALTDHEPPPRIESMDKRLVHAEPPPPDRSNAIGLNPLVGAAAELLSEVVRLRHGPADEDLQKLSKRLTTSIGQFERRALQRGVDDSQVAVAHYVLCTVLDEAVTSSPWGKDSEWAQSSLLSVHHHETSGGERFFVLLGQRMGDPIKHLHMLELMYLCLALGFEGKYRVETRGMLELESLRDDLYRQIRSLRGEVSRVLSPHPEGPRDTRQEPIRIVPAWRVALFTLVCLGVMYAGFAWVLGEQRDRVLQPYQPLDPAAVVPQS